MQRRTLLSLALCVAVALVAAGCSNPCQDLGDRICNCESEGQIRNNCKTNVKSRVRASSPGTNENDLCSALLDTCPDPNGDVNTCAYILNTCPGKVSCGLAIPAPGGGDGCTTVETPLPTLTSSPDQG
ncbi:MAG: hypothetical protein WB493_00900 [Anaeromyxobacteraceae bacterium]